MTPIEKAISHLGGPSKFARALGVTPQAACFWRDRKRVVPAERCPDIERMTGVTCEELRPDLADQWAYLRNSRPQHQEAA